MQKSNYLKQEINPIMKRNILITILLFTCLFSNPLFASEYRPYEWNSDRTLTPLNEQELSYGLYYINRTEQYQYVYNEERSKLFCYVTHHNIIRVNNDEALNNSNQIYIPMRNTIELTAIQARVLTSDGRVIDFDVNNIKELESEDAGYKIFAVEGAEIGSEIEYFYTRKISNSNFITRRVQFSYPVKSYNFSLTCPENLEYDFKIYNASGEILKTDDSEDYNQYELSLDNIPALFEENFAAYDNSKIRLECKLAYNSNVGNKRINTWGVAGKTIYNRINSLSSDEVKAFSKFVKGLDLNGDPLEAFKRAEHYIKTNFFFEKNAGDVGNQIDLILKNKYATSSGFTKLYVALLNHLDIEHEIVLAADRYKHSFDPDFDTWNYLDEYLIYINQSDQFLSVKETSFRLGTIDDSYIGTKALFIKTVQIQDMNYPVAHISMIGSPSYKENFDNLNIGVSFSENLENNTVKVKRSYKGYSSQYYKMAMVMLEEERTKEMLDEIIKYLSQDAEIKNIKVLEEDFNYKNWGDPFEVEGEFNTQQYIESAGDILLFKVGELIGPQSELYQESARTTDVVNFFNRGYFRKININLPDGYSIQNPDDLIINEKVIKNGKTIFVFVSSYTIKGQKLEIEINEYYDELYYPKESFEEFRKVINAAADWNKIILVLE